MPDPIVRRFAIADLDSSVLKRVAGARRLDALFKATASDFLLREQFVTDPAQILAEYVHGGPVSEESASVTNHLLYAVMANRKLRAWLNAYTSEHQGKFPSRDQFLTDFGRAVARDGDEHVIFALIRSTTDKDGTAGFELFESIARSLASIVRTRPGIGLTGGPPTGGPPTGGPPTGGPPTGGPPTGGPPTGGPPTGGPPTGGSVFSHLPDYIQLAMDELIRYATHLRDIGALSLVGANIR